MNKSTERQNDFLPTETELADDYKVWPGYIYLVDGELQGCPLQGTVADLKRCLGAREVRRCDLVARGLFRNEE